MKDYKVVIVGAGPVGMLLACYLGEKGISCLVLERRNFEQHVKPDGKLFSVIEGSRMMLEELGLHFPDAQKISGIKVIPLEREPVTFQPEDGSAMGMMVESHILRSSFIKKMKSLKSVDVMENVEVERAFQNKDFVELHLSSGGDIRCQICVASDGFKSSMRKFFGKKGLNHLYKNSAMVVNLRHESCHEGFACEWFLKDCTMATLPMKDPNLSSLVLMDGKSNIKRLSEMKEGDFLKEVNLRLSSFKAKSVESGRHVYDKLICSILYNPVEGRVVFLGDSAHTLHPLTGQAMNLGFRDAYSLGKLIGKNIMLGISIHQGLSSYRRRRMLDTAFMASFVHGIAWSFESKLASPVAAFLMSKSSMFPFIGKRVLEYATGRGFVVDVGMNV